MSRNGWLGLRVSAIFLLMGSSVARATCWQCAWDPGVEQWYCYSTTGAGAADCIPVSGDYCELAGQSTCDQDHCVCQRYPVALYPKKPQPLAPTNFQVLLLRGEGMADRTAMMARLSTSPIQLDLEGRQFSPELAARKLAGLVNGMPEASVEHVGFSATSRRGPAVSRLVGEDGIGVVLEAIARAGGAHVRVSQVVADSDLRSWREVELQGGRAVVFGVRLGGEDLACVAWAGQVVDQASGASRATEEHHRFVEAATGFRSRRMMTIHADSPTPSIPAPAAPRHPPVGWGELAILYR